MAEVKMNAGRGGKWLSAANAGGRFRWEILRIGSRLGWGASAGVACMALTALIWWQEQRLLVHHRVLTEKLRTAETAALAAPAIDAKEPDVSTQLAAFYDYLPQHDTIPDQLKTLLNVADKSGVTLMQAEYKPQPETHADFLRYQIVLPVKADYAQVQAFMLKSLQEIPTLTLESVSFKRDRIEASEVEARIHFALLVHKRITGRSTQ